MPWVSGIEWTEPVRTLGWQVADWAEEFLRVPGGARYGQPMVLTGWQLRALADWYALDVDGRWLYRRGQIRMAKGTGKSPLAAVVALAELCGPVVFDGVDAHGDPVGRPREAPLVQIAAATEDQGQNTYGAVHAMLAESSLLESAGIDLGVTRTVLRGRPGRLDVVSASAGSREGQPLTAAVCDETHLWTRTNSGRRLYATMQRNASKMGARLLATTNAWVPGDESVAEQIEDTASKRPGIMVFGPQFEAHVEDIGDVEQLRAGVALTYRDAPWVDQVRIVADCQDPDMAVEDVHRFHLNRPVAADAVLCASPLLCDVGLGHGEPVALGFDGSRTTDATALVAVHMDSGVAFLLGYWERPAGLPIRERWEVPREQVTATVEQAFARFTVSRFKVDPSHWQDELGLWQSRWSRDVVDRMPVWQTSIVDKAVEASQTALGSGALSISSAGDRDGLLAAHVQRARVVRRMTGTRVFRNLAKPDEGGRIDCAAALTYAWQARIEANAKGWTPPAAPTQTTPFVMVG